MVQALVGLVFEFRNRHGGDQAGFQKYNNGFYNVQETGGRQTDSKKNSRAFLLKNLDSERFFDFGEKLIHDLVVFHGFNIRIMDNDLYLEQKTAS